MHVSESQIGRQIRCPDCHTKTTVKRPPQPLTSPKPKYSGDEYQLQAGQGQPTSKDSHTYTKVVCRVCETKVSVRVEHIGKRVKCPDCDTANLVKPPPIKKRDFQLPNASDITLESAPPPIPSKQKEIADRLMAEAREQEAEKQSNNPQPTSPVETKLLPFVFRLQILPFWIGLSVGIVGLWALVDMTNSLMANISLASVLGIVTLILTGIVAIMIVAIAVPQLISIVSFTSQGYDRIPYWPSQDLPDRAWAVMFAINASTMAAAPGMLLATFLHPLGVPLWAGLLPFLFLFPFIVMSMMESNSAFVPYSPNVREQFATHRHSCRQFYLQSCGLGAIFAFAIASAWLLNPYLGRLVFAVSFSIYAAIYAQLLGRLAWILGEPEVTDDMQELNADLDSGESI